MSVETKLRNLISEINETTGKNDAYLSKAVASLKKGYLGDTMLQTKRVNVTTNGSRVITPDEGYNALSQVVVTTSVTEDEIEEGFHAYYVEYDPAVADYRKVWICKVNGGEVITIKDGADVPESNVGTKDYNPALKFVGWSCPLVITNNQITVPDVICADVYIGAVYNPADNKDYYVADDGSIYNEEPGSDVDVRGIYFAEGSRDSTPAQGMLAGYGLIERVTLPSTLRTLDAEWAREKYLTHIVIPNGVTTIGMRAFNGCPVLEAVVLPNTLSTIGAYSFYMTKTMHSVLLPYGVTAISDYLFGNSDVIGIHIEAQIAGFTTYCFYMCSVEYLRFPDGIRSLNTPTYLFQGCRNIKKIYSALASYEGRLLESSSYTLTIAGQLKEVNLIKTPLSTTQWTKVWKLNMDSSLWEQYLFRDSAPHWLHVVDDGVIPDSDVSIVGSQSDSGRHYLCRVSGNVNRIGKYAFSQGYHVRHASFPNVTTIGAYAFYNCTALETFESDSIEAIEQRAFLSCPMLKYINFSKVETIEAYALQQTGLVTFDAPKLQLISSHALSGCVNLQTVNIPAVLAIENYGFGDSSNLTEINLPSIQSIAANAFRSSKNPDLRIKCGENLSSIDAYAFGSSSSGYDRNLYLYIEAVTPPTLNGKLVYTSSRCKVIYVPDESVDAYKAATNWSTYSSVIKPISEFVGW